MTVHSERAHAPWSASATARNWACAGALALGATVDKLDVESEAAAWGTACHELSEGCLRFGHDAADKIGTVIKTKQHELTVDEEMADTAQQYVDYVRQQAQGRYVGASVMQLFIEARFSLAKLDPPFDSGGTCDAIVYNPDEKLLEVIDLKGGRGLKVDVTENKQLRTYALGALLAHPDLDVTRVKSTIVQPRIGSGEPRSETYHVTELVEWTAELLLRMRVSKEAEEALVRVKGELMMEAWADKWLVAGSHCTFCPAEGFCPAKKKKAMDVANAFFNDVGAVVIRNQPSELDPSRIAQVLDGADDLQNWLNAVRAFATRMAETGTDIPGYHLADRIGHRKYKRPDYIADDLTALGLKRGDIFEESVRSPAQMEKKLGGAKAKREIVKIGNVEKTREQWFNDLVHKPVTGRSLVSSAKSTRPAVKSTAEAFFGGGALS